MTTSALQGYYQITAAQNFYKHLNHLDDKKHHDIVFSDIVSDFGGAVYEFDFFIGNDRFPKLPVIAFVPPFLSVAVNSQICVIRAKNMAGKVFVCQKKSI